MSLRLTASSTANDVLAAVGDTTGVRTWIEDNVVQLLVLAIGAFILYLAIGKGQRDGGRIMQIVGGLLLGLAVVALAAGGWANIGPWLLGLVGVDTTAAAPTGLGITAPLL